ncbi:MAG: ribose-5-phosphate isomerase RpiA [Verrucomicrobia bacterium]|nr:ribose-5-phosphate isomerase RpiA [Verrucomicrobiota bacterium]MBV9674245.1 ribose-5-phosphate isomerase RpiA [Verrucomicrobiota bacterium]
MKSLSAQDEAKRAAAEKAIEAFLKDGMIVGLGSGTTSRWFVRILGDKVKEGLKVVGVPSSKSTKELAQEVGVALAELNDVQELDLTIDGADEIDPEGRMIKGGGANLLWEKIVATASRTMVAIVDESKAVKQLGKFPLPVEIVQFGWRSTERHMSQLFKSEGYGDTEMTVRGGLERPLITDSGNFILDCHLQAIANPDSLVVQLNRIAGVVENGLFIGIAKSAVVGRTDSPAEVIHFPVK